VSGRIPELDGLRGIAILLVLTLHYLSDGSQDVFGTLLYRFCSAFRLGWAGVDLFFVLSGFLIGGILLDARESQNYFRTFYLRRLCRIVPIYYVWVTAYAVAVLFAGTYFSALLPVDLHSANYLPAYYLFIQNYISLQHGSLGWFWLAVAWSLGVEEQFYLVAPPLIRYLSAVRLKQVLVGTLVAAPLLRAVLYFLWPGGRFAMFVWMPCRADSLAVGVLAAVLWKEGSICVWYRTHRRMLMGGLILFGGSLPAFTKWLPSPYGLWMGVFGYSWLAVFFAGLLLLAVLESGGLWSRFLRWGFLREMGCLSYCIYLIHLLLLGLCHAWILHAAPRVTDLAGAAVTLLAAVLTYGLAKCSWLFFEGPIVRRGHAFRYVIGQNWRGTKDLAVQENPT
jgi:peptidoglycan/LPS O-acetylase OafA/YrhL